MKSGPSKLFKFPLQSNKTCANWYAHGKKLVDVGIDFDYKYVSLRNIDGKILEDVQGVLVTFKTGADYTHFLLRFGNEPFGLKMTNTYTAVARSAGARSNNGKMCTIPYARINGR